MPKYIENISDKGYYLIVVKEKGLGHLGSINSFNFIVVQIHRTLKVVAKVNCSVVRRKNEFVIKSNMRKNEQLTITLERHAGQFVSAYLESDRYFSIAYLGYKFELSH